MSYRQSPNGVVDQHFCLGLIGEAVRRVRGGGGGWEDSGADSGIRLLTCRFVFVGWERLMFFLAPRKWRVRM